MDIKFINATIIDAKNTIKGSLIIRDGVIYSINDKTTCDNTIDLKGKVIMPSFIDMHTHLREPGYEYKEDITSGMKAALSGGFTTVCAMANTNPTMDNYNLISGIIKKAKKQNLCDYIQISAIGKSLQDKKFVDIEKIQTLTPLFSNDGNTIFNDDFMEKALQKSKQHNFLLLTHCQPETEIIARDTALLEKVGGNLHVCHVSKSASINLIRKAKEKGLDITCEVTPHHLFYTDKLYKVNPPLRSNQDVDAIIQAIKDGTIDICATDHAPHSQEDKENGAPGISNIEVAFSMYYTVFSQNDIPLNKLSEMLSYKPAQLLKQKTGLIQAEYPANFVIIDKEKEYKINREKFVSKSNNTPFNGETVKGKILQTYLKGELKYDSRQTI